VVAAALILLTGLFLAPLFEDLPQATLAAIVIVAISSFFRVDELRRFARLRRTAIVLSLVALAGVLVLGVLPGLLLAVALSLVELVRRLSAPPVALLARDPGAGGWANRDRHPDWATPPGVLVVGVEGPLFYANSVIVKNRILELVEATHPTPAALVLDLVRNDEIDVQALDMLGELANELGAQGVELRLAGVHVAVLVLLRRSGLAERLRVERTIDAAVAGR
jgi:MFS superfamily sulfate permease-like transporter